MDTITYKIITLGLYGVGKTCLLLRATQENSELPHEHKCTIGVDFKIRIHPLNNTNYKFIIWDTAGQERFFHINRLYYKETNAVLLVFDTGDRKSFEKINFFYYDFKQTYNQPCAFLLIGTKIDKSSREVSKNEGKNLAKTMSMPYIECSAFTGEGIDRIFDVVLKEIEVQKVTRSEIESFLISYPPPSKKKSVSKCC